ncbi:VOC family protein [Streptococcus sp. X16XC17]|uniref:VOC family protein n=1 Tax=unclassified Streptococcus TaxID=2608887 RepID=UPI000AEDD0E6|nr:VOC family protein [Streptococcus sp. X16XC17]
MANSKASSQFYATVFSVDEKFAVPTASWLASGDYHHHIAVNEWSGPHQSKRSSGMHGLAYFQVQFHKEAALSSAISKAKTMGVEVQVLDSYTIVTDPDGVEIHLMLL